MKLERPGPQHKKLGLDSVGNKKPWQTLEPCRILASDPLSHLFGTNTWNTNNSCLTTIPHHQHQYLSFKIIYYYYPKITPWIPSVQLLDQNEASNLTEAISTKPGTQFEMMERSGSCYRGRLVQSETRWLAVLSPDHICTLYSSLVLPWKNSQLL